MGLLELFLAVLVVGISCVNAAPPALAWSRAGDPRFLALAAANALLAVVGAVWVWGQIPLGAPGWSAVSSPIAGLVVLVALLMLATTLLPRHS